MNLAMRGRKGRKLFGEAGSLDLATYANARLRLELNEQAKRAAGGFGPWLKEVTPEWQWEPIHFRYARWYLNKVTHKQIQKLMIFMPPRHGKTEQNTIRYAAYRIELDPTIKVMVVSYNKELASDFSRKIMAIVEQRVELSTKKRAAHKWETKAGGALNAFGVRGVGGGRGYDLIILDDVIKNADEANSPRYRQRMWDSWLNDISKRVNPGCSIIITFTRWHRDDLAGRILESEDAPNWTVVKLAALAEANDPMGRPEGMALWPERWSEEWLRGEQRIDIYAFESLFQQNPTPPGGKMFDGAWTSDCYVDALPGGCRYVRYWDKACLIAGTMIHTSEGQKSIETIRAGDMVLTRQGYKEVQWAGLTGIRDDITSVTFGNGQTVTGTKDHLVWTENRGWVPLAGIMSTDYTLNTLKGGDSWESVKVGSGLQTPRQSSSTALRTLGVLARNTSQRIVGTRNARGIGRTFSIGLCGENGRVKFRKGGKSITRMRTRPITRLITLNASLKVSISGVMACLLNGIRLRKGKNTRGSLTFRSGRMHPIGITFASNVGPHFSLDASTHRLNIARPSAESVTARPVYDIQVKDCHEFFANGVLVHNSTQGGTGAATAGVLMAKTPKGQYIICDVERGRWGSTEREERIKATAFRDGTITEIRVEREPGSSGKESAEATIRNLEGFACTEDRVTGDKVVRAQPLASRCKVGDVKLLKDSPYKRWNGTFLAELEVFPQGQLKDQVDAAAGAYNYLALSDAMGLPVVAQRATVQNHPTLWLPNQELWSPGL